MTRPSRPLTFTAVDGLGFAAARGMLAAQQNTPYVPVSIGPLFELLYLGDSGLLPDPPSSEWLLKNGTGAMVSALKENRESSDQLRGPSDRIH